MRTALLLALALALAACGPTLPKLPEIDFTPLSPAVRQAVEQAHSDAEFTPGDSLRAAQLAKVLHAHGLLDAAIVYYQHARKLDPDNATHMHLLGVAHFERGNHPAAIEALNAALTRNAGAPPTKFVLAQTLLASGATVEAGALFRALGDHPVARLGLGQTLQGAEQIEEFRKALALEPRYGAAWKALADAHRTRGNTEKAAEADRAYARYRNFTPSTGDAQMAAVREMNVNASGLLARAHRAESEMRLLDATKLLEQVIAADLNDDASTANLVSIYLRLKDHAAAEKTCGNGLLRKPESAALTAARGLVLVATQRRAEAKPLFEKAVAADANQAEAWFQLGLFAASDGAAQQALDHFGRCLYSDPAHRAARYHAAMILAKNRKPDLAREQLELAVQGPEDELTPKARQALAELR